jgi:hypothetical protein
MARSSKSQRDKPAPGAKASTAATVPAAPPMPRAIPLLLAALLLLGWFSTEFKDSDAWWHLKTGEYLWQQHKLPVPDPFAWTTSLGGSAYAGEDKVRYFNLTHEWLAQVVFFLAYAAGGFPGLILFRAALLTAFCGIVGLVAYHRSGGFYRSIAAALLAGAVSLQFASDRPFLFGFVFLAAVIAALEFRRGLWLLPPMFAVWANMHGGYFLGWAPLGVYCADAWLRKDPMAEQKRLWLVTVASVAASGINPNGFRALWVALAYQGSAMQSALMEWQHTAFWEASWFSAVLFASVLALAISYKRVRPADWMLFAMFAAASIWAVRNVILIALLGPILLVSYLPLKRDLPRAAAWLGAIFLLAGIAFGIVQGKAFQLRAATWRYPDGAAEFVLKNGISGKMFNTYGSGGFLIWKMWPKQQVFIDGRALNESLYPDYRKILTQADDAVLAKYGIDIIVSEGFDSGDAMIPLVAILSDPSQKDWKLVYQGLGGFVFLRNPPPGMPVLNSLDALTGLEAQCSYRMTTQGARTCARSLSNLFTQIGDRARAARWAVE